MSSRAGVQSQGQDPCCCPGQGGVAAGHLSEDAQAVPPPSVSSHAPTWKIGKRFKKRLEHRD